MYKLRDWIPESKLQWWSLSENPNAIQMLEANPDKIHWGMLSLNPAAMHLLEANQDKINWYWLSANPSIFTYDYKKMVRPFTEELMVNRFHPQNVEKFEDWGF